MDEAIESRESTRLGRDKERKEGGRKEEGRKKIKRKSRVGPRCKYGWDMAGLEKVKVP
jgi:hypothetical protein